MWGYGPDWGMAGSGIWWGPFGMIIWLLILIVVVVAVVWLLRPTTHGGGREPASPRRSTGLDILEERYARGEIDRDEYLQKKGDLTG